MEDRKRYLLIWVPTEPLLRVAREKGWSPEMDSGPLDYAAPEQLSEYEEFKTHAQALARAGEVLADDFFGQVTIEEQDEEIEQLSDGPYREWVTYRRQTFDHQGADQWERVEPS